MNLVANITHDSIDLVLIKFNTQFRLKAPECRASTSCICFPNYFHRPEVEWANGSISKITSTITGAPTGKLCTP